MLVSLSPINRFSRYACRSAIPEASWSATIPAASPSAIKFIRSTLIIDSRVFCLCAEDWTTIELSANVLGKLLLGWTPNPGTAVYVGYDDYLNYNGFNSVTGRFEPGLHRNERVFFLKMSYLFRHSFK